MKLSKKDLVKALHTAGKDIKVLEKLLVHLLTPKEQDEFAVRVEILKRMLRGDDQRSIAKELKIGIATVTRGSREIRTMSSKIKALFK